MPPVIGSRLYVSAAPQHRQHHEEEKHSPEQIINKLRQVEALTAQGATIAEAARQIQVAEQTYYRWKKRYGGMDQSQAKRLKHLEQENARLKKLLAEKDLDNDILREALQGK